MQETKPKLESSTAPPASTCLEPHWMEHDRTIFHSSSSANSPSDQGISCFLQFRHQQSTCHAPLNGRKKRGNSRRHETTWLHIISHPSSAPWRHEGHEGLLTLPQGLHKGSLRCSNRRSGQRPSESCKTPKAFEDFETFLKNIFEQTPQLSNDL